MVAITLERATRSIRRPTDPRATVFMSYHLLSCLQADYTSTLWYTSVTNLFRSLDATTSTLGDSLIKHFASREWITLFVTLFFFVVSGAFAVWCYIESQPSAEAQPVLAPQLQIISDQQSLSASYSIEYYAYAQQSPAGVTLGSNSQSQPVGSRVIRLNLYDATPRPPHEVRYAILLNSDAAQYATISTPGSPVQIGSPGSEVESACQEANSFNATQVVVGSVMLGESGQASIEVVGGVKGKISPDDSQERLLINVMKIVPVGVRAGNQDPQGRPCDIVYPDWPYLGGAAWNGVSLTDGVVNVGSTGAEESVDSANPPLAAQSVLRWELIGPGSVSYTLVNDSIQKARDSYLFAAGVLAALAATLFVEVAKAAIDIRFPKEVKRDVHERSPVVPTANHPSPKATSSNSTPAAASAALLGLIFLIRWLRARIK